MSDLPKFTEADIRELVDPKIFNRGREYQRDGVIQNPKIQNNKIWATCYGTEVYHLHLKLADHQIIESHCDCPYDWGQYCKHQVALLLTYVHQAHLFQAIAPLPELLADYSRDELLNLIEIFLKKEPRLLDLLSPSSNNSQKPIVNTKAIFKAAKYAIRNNDDDYNIRELRSLSNQADDYRNAGDYLNAGTIYCTLLDAFDSNYDLEIDYDDELADLTSEYVENLGECLLLGSQNIPPNDRRKWLEELLKAFLKDIDLGGVGYGDYADDYLQRCADEEEWDEIKDACLKVLEYTSSAWAREAIVRLLGDRLSPQENIKLITEKGSPSQKIQVYLDLGNYQSAHDIALEHYTYEVRLILELADRFVESQQNLLAISLMSKFLQKEGETNRGRSKFYWEWLANYYLQQRDFKQAKTYAQKALLTVQDFQYYQLLRKIAKLDDTWEDLRLFVLKELQTKQAMTVLIDIAIDENNLSWTMELLDQQKQNNSYPYSHVDTTRYKDAIKLAKSINRFEVAISLYSELAELEIKQKNRKHYVEAAKYLHEIKACFQSQNNLQEWTFYLDQFKKKYCKLPALMDECKYLN